MFHSAVIACYNTLISFLGEGELTSVHGIIDIKVVLLSFKSIKLKIENIVIFL